MPAQKGTFFARKGKKKNDKTRYSRSPGDKPQKVTREGPSQVSLDDRTRLLVYLTHGFIVPVEEHLETGTQINS